MRVRTSPDQSILLEEGDTLLAGDILPGFRLVSTDVELTREDRPERALGAVNHWGEGPSDPGVAEVVHREGRPGRRLAVGTRPEAVPSLDLQVGPFRAP